MLISLCFYSSSKRLQQRNLKTCFPHLLSQISHFIMKDYSVIFAIMRSEELKALGQLPF